MKSRLFGLPEEFRPRESLVEEQARANAIESRVYDDDVGITAAVVNAGHTGAMIALVPHDFDARRLALGGPADESVEELHCTLLYLGDASTWDDAARAAVLEHCQEVAAQLPPIDAEMFGLSLFNPTGEEPCWVGICGGDALDVVHDMIAAWCEHETYGALVPENHSPWVAHVTLTYDVESEAADGGDLVRRAGPVTFDRLRVAFGDVVTDLPLTQDPGALQSPPEAERENSMPWHIVENHVDCPATRPWGVVKDDDGTTEGCHDTREAAQAQLDALNAAESEAGVDGTATTNGRRTFKRRRAFADEPVPMPTPEAPVAPVETLDVPDINAAPTFMLWATGAFDVHGQWGSEAARLVADDWLRGVSVTLDDVNENDVELIWPDEDPGADEMDALFMEPEMAIFHHARVIDATLTPLPALQEAYIEVDPDDPTRWRGVLAVEGKPTGDGRMFADQSLEWRDLPIALMWQEKTDEGHDQSVLVGRIETIERQPYVARGGDVATIPAVAPSAAVEVHDTLTSDQPWDADVHHARITATPEAVYAFAWAADGVMTFLHHEVDGNGAIGAANLTACASVIGALNGGRGYASIPPADRQGVYNHVAAHLRAAGQTPPPLVSVDEIESLGASSSQAPPASWFVDPKLTGPTPLVVSDDGRVYGHLARWGTCHTSFPGTCVTPPREESYDYFTTGEVVCADGARVPVGQLTLGTGHAAAKFGHRPTVEHYDHSGHAVADVTAGSDEFGIWVAGAVRPGATHSDVHTLRASALSGDWRRIGGKLRLVAALCVNVPGFPIPRTRAHVHDGAQVALVAAGVLRPTPPSTARAIDRIAATIGRDHDSRLRERREALMSRVHSNGG